MHLIAPQNQKPPAAGLRPRLHWRAY